MQEISAEGRRATALALFHSGKYEEAAQEFRAELDAHEDSETWNDWAAAETFCGRTDSAISGFTRALQLDPANAQARDNLLAILKHCVKQLEQVKVKADDERSLVARPHDREGLSGSPSTTLLERPVKRHGKRRHKKSR